MTSTSEGKPLKYPGETVGAVFVLVAVFGSEIAQKWGWADFLAGSGTRLYIAFFGSLVWASNLGIKTQRLWKMDEGWSPQVIGHGAAAALGWAAMILVAILWAAL